MIPTDLTLKAYQDRVDDWIQEIGVRYFSELTNLAQLMEEVGELARIMSRTYGDQSFKDSEADARLSDELADVLFVLTCIANQAGVDLTRAAIANLDKKRERDRMRHINNPKLRMTAPVAPDHDAPVKTGVPISLNHDRPIPDSGRPWEKSRP